MELDIVRPMITVIPRPNANPRAIVYSELGRGWSKSKALRVSFIHNFEKSRKFCLLGLSTHFEIITRGHRRQMHYSPRCHGITCLSEGAMPEDAHYMRMCISLAEKALGCTSPNPMVGCVIVKDGHIVGQGFHPKAGEPHAEIPSLAGLIKAFHKHWDDGDVEEEYIENPHSFHAISDAEPLEDQTSFSSHDLLVHEILDPEEDKYDEVIEHPIATPHEEYIGDKGTQTSTSSSLEDKGLVFALREAGAKAEGATAYVSLEPCNHYGRTPPCTQALIQARVGRVVMGMVDPNPVVAAKGVAMLRNSGIDVTVGVEEQLCQTLNEAYIHRMLTGKPFVTMRFSISLDGGMLDDLGDGGVEEGGYYSKMLQQYDGVIVSDHAVYHNQIFLSSEVGAKQPLRIVVTRTLDLPIDSLIFNTDLAPTLILADEKAIVHNLQSAGKLNSQTMDMLLQQKGVEVIILKKLEIDSVLDICSQRGLCSVLIESRGLASAGLENFLGKQALEEEAVQKLVIAICPMISGNKRTALNFDIPPAKLYRLTTKLSKDVAVVEGYFQRDLC